MFPSLAGVACPNQIELPGRDDPIDQPRWPRPRSGTDTPSRASSSFAYRPAPATTTASASPPFCRLDRIKIIAAVSWELLGVDLPRRVRHFVGFFLGSSALPLRLYSSSLPPKPTLAVTFSFFSFVNSSLSPLRFVIQHFLQSQRGKHGFTAHVEEDLRADLFVGSLEPKSSSPS